MRLCRSVDPLIGQVAMLRLARLMLVAGLALAAAAAADERIYSDAELQQDQARYGQRFQFLLKTLLWDHMTWRERLTLREVVVLHPLRGSGPLAFEANVQDGAAVVRAPLATLKFIEDLSVAYAWRYRNQYSLEPIEEYLVLLRQQSDGGASIDPLPPPLPALGVPPRVWERDARVDDLSLRLRNTAWAFVLAHELGHLHFGHRHHRESPAQIQQQEMAADRFAVDLLARSNTLPLGAIIWFDATARYMKNRDDFDTAAAYRAWLAGEIRHPVSGSRMRSLAAVMARQATFTRDLNRAELLRFIATRLAAIGATIDDPGMQQYLERCAASRRIEDLSRRDDRPCH